jgi:hypothetical protein
MASQSSTHVFLLPALIDNIPKTQVPERQKLKMLLEPGLLAGPLPWGHGGIPTASQSSTHVSFFTSVDRRYPKKNKSQKDKG